MVRRITLLLVSLCFTAGSLAGDLKVTLPDGQTLTAQAIHGKPVELTDRNGTRLLGVDMSWYASAKPGGSPPSDDDRKEIQQILTVPSFYDKLNVLDLSGDNQHAVALIELLRDREFHAGDKEVIWRLEIWYFEFQNGGWAKVSQQNKILDRQRFPDRDALVKYVSTRRWVAKLGAVPEGVQQIQLSNDDLIRSPLAEPRQGTAH
jgi:hypothetical protein